MPEATLHAILARLALQATDNQVSIPVSSFQVYDLLPARIVSNQKGYANRIRLADALVE